MNYASIIGLEIHVQLKTASKMFCRCKNELDIENPNKNTCPVCMGHPGTLPVLNKQALDYGLMVAMALNCQIPVQSKFDRKNYFYPDLPKGYQISQYDQPIGQNGHLIITENERRIRVGINRVHLEEDAAKLIHPKGAIHTLVDYNRSGVPLLEIVTEPDLRSPQTAKTFLQELKTILQYSGVSDADMEKGHLRCDANISLQPADDVTLYPKTEIKNLNSFRAVERALQFEIDRQTALWNEGQPPQNQTTRGWNDEQGKTEEQRTKEAAHDYRYFPEPDIPPLRIDEEYQRKIRISLPELPDPKRKRFMEQFGITMKDAVILSHSRRLSEFFEAVIDEARTWIKTKEGTADMPDAEFQKIIQLCINWITTELFKLINETGMKMNEVKITPENMAELISMLFKKEINSTTGRMILKEMFETGGDPSQIVDAKQLRQVSDEGKISEVVQRVIENNQSTVEKYQKGKTNALQYLIGQVMKEMKGQANPEIAKKLLLENINSR